MKCFLFLRAVNVGKRKMPSAPLTKLLQDLGFNHAGCFLASGNAFFETRKRSLTAMEKQLEKAVEDRFGFFAECFLRDAVDLQELATSNPFGLTVAEQQDYLVNVAFFKGPVTRKSMAEVFPLAGSYDDFAIHRGHLFWLCRGPKMMDSPIAEVLPKKLPSPTTLRKQSSLRRMVDKFLAE